jgi:glycosyltransferase involved in cell wall biosynthesis
VIAPIIAVYAAVHGRGLQLLMDLSQQPDPAPVLSVVIPAYNELATIEPIIAAVQAVEIDKEIIAVDDCSSDGTRERLQEIARNQEPRLRLICHDRNRGKGAALRTGIAATRGAYVIVQDADLEYLPSEYPKLLKPLLDGKADVVFGSRFMGDEERRVFYFWHALGNRLLTSLSNMFTNLNLSDMETGYKAFRGEVIRSIKIQENRFGFEPEITAKVARFRRNGLPLRIYEVGISYHGRTYEEGKKIGWRDGLWSLWCILRYH